MTFIVFEGIDGAGKTTQIALLKEWLEKAGYRVRVVKFPYIECELTGKLLESYVKNKLRDMEKRTITDIFYWNIKTHSHMCTATDVDFVIVDRYYDSHAAYARAQNSQIQRDFADLPIPDLVFYMKIGSRIARKRIERRGGEENFSGHDLPDFLDCVNLEFNLLCRTDRHVVVDACQPREKVHSDIVAAFRVKFNLK